MTLNSLYVLGTVTLPQKFLSVLMLAPAEDGAKEGAVTHGPNLVDIWDDMTIPSKVLAVLMVLMGIFAVGVIIERGSRFIKASSQSLDFVGQLRQYLTKGNIDGAIASARDFQLSPIAKVMEAGLKEYKGGAAIHRASEGEYDVLEAIHRQVERVRDRETTNLRRGLGGLATVASSAPFVGLLGTVVGIINAFYSLAEKGGTIKEVGPSISEALWNTAIGLGVAIIAAVFFNIFTGLVERFVVDMNDVSTEFVGYVARGGEGQGGHQKK